MPDYKYGIFKSLFILPIVEPFAAGPLLLVLAEIPKPVGERLSSNDEEMRMKAK